MSTAAFTLDTEGAIRLVPAAVDPEGPILRWVDLNPIARGYLKAGITSLGDIWMEEPRPPMCGPAFQPQIVRPGYRHLAATSLGQALIDCTVLREEAKSGLALEGLGTAFWRLRADGQIGDFSQIKASVMDGEVVFG